MEMNLDIRLEGARDLSRALNQLPEALSQSILKDSLRRGSQPILHAARRNLRAALNGRRWVTGANGRKRLIRGHTGNLLRSIRMVVRSYRNTGTVVAVVGTSWPTGAHGHLFEFGTTERFALHGVGKKLGKRSKRLLVAIGAGLRRGRMPAKPFLRPALETTSGQVVAGISAALRTGIERFFVKQVSRGR